MNTKNQNQISRKAPKHQTEMVFNAFSPAGTRRAPGSVRYFFSLLGQAAKHEQEVI